MGENLRSKNKGELIDLINQLRTENIALKAAQELFLQQSERIEKLERSFYLQQQYVRRDTIEITGIPATVEQVQLENEVIKIYNAAGVGVDGDAVKNRHTSSPQNWKKGHNNLQISQQKVCKSRTIQ